MNASTLREAPSAELAEAVYELKGVVSDFDPLLDLVGNSNYVLLGEATHGTHEFYKARAEISKRLILEKGFNVLAWESDWPDALRVNRYVRDTASEDQSGLEALGDYRRFPRWMWRNADILDLVGWIKAHNEGLEAKQPRVGVYGLDLYSLHSSMNAVIHYLEKLDSKSAQAARQRYSCFEEFGDDPQSYGLTASVHPSLSCEDEVVAQLVDLQQHASDFLRRDGRIAEDELFYAKQNARVAKGAEQYYRAMYRGRPNTWNLRDTHMVDTLDALMQHFREHGERPKAIIWAHNSHLGDARHTQMGKRGELNIGQLIRERHERASASVGFTTYAGSVTAASNWDAPAERMQVRPGMEGSYELLFHELAPHKFLIIPREDQEVYDFLSQPLLERAIGVIYRPETERYSHYFTARVAQQFDAIIHFDETRAVEPLDRTANWERGELPETFPSGY
jgi:erythromycin esterase-like protein